MEYAHWVEEQNRQICELRNALQAHITDVELNILVEHGYSHYYNLFRMKADAAKADVFYLISGVWRTSAERFFHWIGGFRPSELLNVISSSFISVLEDCFSLFIYFLVFGIDSLFTSSLSGSYHYGMPYLLPCSRTAYLNKLFLFRHINFFIKKKLKLIMQHSATVLEKWLQAEVPIILQPQGIYKISPLWSCCMIISRARWYRNA